MLLKKPRIDKEMESLEGWKNDNGCIKKTYSFTDFLQAIKFVNEVAKAAESENHHPDMKINYREVEMSLTTHDEGGLTEKDISMARKIEGMWLKMKR